MIRWHDDYKILFGDRDKFNQWFIVDLGTETNVVFLLFQALQNLVCDDLIAVQRKVNLFSLVLIQKPTQDPGNKITSQSSQKSNIDPAFAFTGKLQIANRSIELLQNILGIGKERFSVFGKGDIPSVFLK